MPPVSRPAAGIVRLGRTRSPEATGLLAEFTTGKTFDDYNHNAMLRAAVEREFQIIGEEISQRAKFDPQIASAISEFRRIIAFRNILIRGYADVDNTLVWNIMETKLPILLLRNSHAQPPSGVLG